MIRGFVTGVIWGGVVAATGLAVVSQVAPLPDRQEAAAAPEAALPPVVAGGDTSPATPEIAAPEAVVPETTATDPAQSPATAEPAAPEVVEVAPPPPEALQPEILQKVPEPAVEAPPAPDAEGGTPGADLAAGPAAEEAIADQMLAQPEGIGDTAPPAPEAPMMSEAELSIPGTVGESPLDGTSGPDIGVLAVEPPAAPMDEVLPQPAETPPPEPAPVEEALLQPAPDPTEPPAPALIVPDAPLPSVPGPQADAEPAEAAQAVPNVRTDRLPRIGDDSLPPADGMGQVETDAVLLPEAVLGTTPLELFRRDFDNPDAKPLFGIILIDEGLSAEERARLAALPFAISFAIDPLGPDSAAAAGVYRSAGQEVVMLANGIPQGATPGDLEQTFQALDMALPEAVAVLDRMEGGFQDTLDLARQAVPIVAEQGRGIVTYERGLNSADQVARREGVPRATIFRVLDGEGESIPKMRNYLDRAAFKAAQEGRVLVIGRARPETVAAILEWTVEGRAASVALAPISAVMETVPSP